MRGTWFFQKTDESYHPYEEEICERLQAAFISSRSRTSSGIGVDDAPVCVDVGWGRVVRRAQGEATGGGYVQVS
jgi:hypothetical protein